MSESKVLIWSIEHTAWWKPNSRGYTTDQGAAGFYTRLEAQKIVDGSDGKNEVAVVPFTSPESGDDDGILRLEHLKRVKLEPGDFLVLESPHALADAHVKHLGDVMKRVFGEGHKMIVLEEGMKLGVVSPGEKPKGHYQTDGEGDLICPHCEAVTHSAYAMVPNLPCWDCGKPMEITT